jgi:hypothetical protein
MLFPAAKLGDTIIGLDFHSTTQTVVPPVPYPLFPHPFIGTIFLWHTPKWPAATVFINGAPAITVGAKSYSVHIPLPPPAVPTPPPQVRFRWYLQNLMTAGIAAMFSMVLNMIGAATGTLTPTSRSPDTALPEPVGNQDDWQKIQALLPVQSWLQLFQMLLPPAVMPVAEGNVAIGSPTVTVNGAPLAFIGPLTCSSCSKIPIVPNANTVGFSNVMVGVTLKELAFQFVWNALHATAAVGAGMLAESAMTGRSH